VGAHPPFGPLSRWGLNPIKPVYDPYRPDGRLNLTASAFNQLGQYTSNPGRRGYCYAELAVFFPDDVSRTREQNGFGWGKYVWSSWLPDGNYTFEMKWISVSGYHRYQWHETTDKNAIYRYQFSCG